MGDNGLKRTDEDEMCEIHLRNRLEKRPGDPDADTLGRDAGYRIVRPATVTTIHNNPTSPPKNAQTSPPGTEGRATAKSSARYWCLSTRYDSSSALSIR
jgi:hypothetical protein